MDMYKDIVRNRVRFNTSKGQLTVEQLWDLSPEELDSIAVSLEEQYKNSGRKSYLQKNTPKDKLLKLQLETVLDILETLVDERDAARQKAEDKAHNEKILGLIANKQDEELAGKSVQELRGMLRG